MKNNTLLLKSSIIVLVGMIILGGVSTVIRTQLQEPRSYNAQISDMQFDDTHPQILYAPRSSSGGPRNHSLFEATGTEILSANEGVSPIIVSPSEYLLQVTNSTREGKTTDYFRAKDGDITPFSVPKNVDIDHLVESPDGRYWMTGAYQPSIWKIYDTQTDAWIDIDEKRILDPRWEIGKDGYLKGTLAHIGWIADEPHTVYFGLENSPQKGGPEEGITRHALDVETKDVREVSDDDAEKKIKKPFENIGYRALCDNGNIVSAYFAMNTMCDVDAPEHLKFIIERNSTGRNTVLLNNTKTNDEHVVKLSLNVGRTVYVAAEWLGDTEKIVIQEGPNVSIYDMKTKQHALLFTIENYAEQKTYPGEILMVMPQTNS
jgi:hypothetical protein